MNVIGGKYLRVTAACVVVCLISATPLFADDAATEPANTLSLVNTPTSNTNSELSGMSLEDLMSVKVTSVSKTEQRIGDAPAAVTVISQEDIQRSGLHEIPEILRLSPG